MAKFLCTYQVTIQYEEEIEAFSGAEAKTLIENRMGADRVRIHYVLPVEDNDDSDETPTIPKISLLPAGSRAEPLG